MRILIELRESDDGEGGRLSLDTSSTAYVELASFNVAQAIDFLYEHTLPGRLQPGQQRIVYIAGDQELNVTGETAVEEFARRHSGTFLVVAVSIEK